MIVYDFDGTIYDGNSTTDFYKFIILKKPWLIWTVAPNAYNAFLFKIGILSREQFKEKYFQVFLPFIDTDKNVTEFWLKYKKRIKGWYLRQKKADDLIISASPEFLLKNICRQLKVNLIATKVNSKTGKFESVNYRGKEKVCIYKKVYGNQEISAFYTDSISDRPMAMLAKAAYLVKKDKITCINDLTDDFSNKKLLNDKRIRFLLVGGTATVIDFGLFNIFRLVMSTTIIANILSTGIAMIFSFTYNKKFTFGSKSKKYAQEVVLFFTFTIFGLWVIQNFVICCVLGVMPLSLPNWVGINLAKAIGTLVSMCWNYLTYSNIVFKHKTKA